MLTTCDEIENTINAVCDILEQSDYPCSYREVEYFINNAFDAVTAPLMTTVEWAVNIAEMIREELESCPTCGCTHEQGFKAQVRDCPQCGFGPIEIVENMPHIK